MATPDTEAPEILDTEEVYHGRVIDVSVYTVRENEVTYKREVVYHPGGAGVVAVFDDGTIPLVRQYRQPTMRYVLELPAGRLDPPERPEECAARELEEEFGVSAPDALRSLRSFSRRRASVKRNCGFIWRRI